MQIKFYLISIQHKARYFGKVTNVQDFSFKCDTMTKDVTNVQVFNSWSQTKNHKVRFSMYDLQYSAMC